MQVSHLFAGKPQAFGPKNSPSSIIKEAYTQLTINYEGALEDEQGNKKLHGGPFMALHQYAQSSYELLKKAFPYSKVDFNIGSIGENLSAPSMDNNNVYIGDQYKIGSCRIQVVSPRAPCSKINHRFQTASRTKVDQFIANNRITGWYYSVVEEGIITIGDNIELAHREENAMSVSQIWQIRELNKIALNTLPTQQINTFIALAETAINTAALAPEWQAHLQRVMVKLSKTI